MRGGKTVESKSGLNQFKIYDLHLMNEIHNWFVDDVHIGRKKVLKFFAWNF